MYILFATVQTVWNVENKICGATDIPLTELGHQQAIETGKKIVEEGIQADEILYSPLSRAAETARHISEITAFRPEWNRVLSSKISESGSPRPETGWNLRRRRKISAAAMTVENPCFTWRSGFTICWTM